MKFIQSITITEISGMNLAIGLLSMLALGIFAMGLCYLFLKGCEKI
jgi:VIT1/CCC1 family predicted Fe2+/Mn2+ transporter